MAVLAGTASTAHAQAFDGTWTGTTICPQFRNSAGYSENVTATIVRSQFRLERNGPQLHELTQGTVQPDGTILATGQGQRRDTLVAWYTRFSGRASSTTVTLTGTRYEGRRCVIHLLNTHPAPYSSAGLEIARQNQIAQAEAERQAAAERQRAAKAGRAAADLANRRVAQHAAQTKMASAQAAKVADLQHQLTALRAAQEKLADEETANQKATEQERQRLIADAEAAKTKAGDLERQLTQLRAAQQKQADGALTFLGDMVLPAFEQPNDWILHKAAIPIQQQEFCRIINRFRPDLEQVQQVKNEIRSNMLYRDREQDLETLLPRGRFENWVVHVIKVSEVADGSAAIQLQPPCEAMLASAGCPKNASAMRATIKPDTPIFRELEKIGHNDFVVVSGTILYLSQENQKEELPKYALYKAGEYCSESVGTKKEEVFVTNIDYLVKLQ